MKLGVVIVALLLLMTSCGDFDQYLCKQMQSKDPECTRHQNKTDDAETARFRDALERIALLDEADGHQLTWEHASRAVAIATSTLGKHPSQILVDRETRAAAQRKSLR